MKTKNLQGRRKNLQVPNLTRRVKPVAVTNPRRTRPPPTTGVGGALPGDNQRSLDKDQRVVFASQSALSEAINQQLEAETGSATPSGYLCMDPAFVREATTVINVLKSMKKYLPIIDRRTRLRSGDPPVEQLISSSDQQRAGAALGNFVYETLGNIYKSRGTRVSAVRLGPHARSTLDAAEKLLTPVQAIDEADLMEKLYGELDSDLTRKTSKALLQAGKQSTTSTSAITPIMGPPRCLVCLRDHYKPNADCNMRCKKCTGAIPLLHNHAGACNY